MHLNQATPEQLCEWQKSLQQQYQAIQQEGLNLDITRGKPSADQLDLSNELDGILQGQYTDSKGADLRNYGGLDGIPEAKILFADVMGVQPEQLMVGGNASLTLMHFAVETALINGVSGGGSAWSLEGHSIKFLTPVPGYDRHFSVCEHLGIEMIPVPMNDDGPDMDQVEQLLKADSSIKGIWCVPRFSNPTGVVYSDDVVKRMAKLAHIAGDNFRIFWDNAYAVHILSNDAPQLANIMDYCQAEGTEDSVYIFGSTSKITFAGAGVSFIASSKANLAELRRNFSFTSIGPDKINQLRHVKFLKDADNLHKHMARHAAILQPRFDAVLNALRTELADGDMGCWTEPQGGYFISFNAQPGLATEIIQLAAKAGVKLTPAGATFPYGNDPEDKNIRLAPSYPTVIEIEKAMEVFVICVKLASIKKALSDSKR